MTRYSTLVRPFPALIVALVVAAGQILAPAATAADRGKLKAFLDITGYDVVIESLQQGAMAGPGMTGGMPDAFGRQYTRLAEEVFEPTAMVARALDILEAVMPDDLVDAGAGLYASDLGQRLVAVENASHMADDKTKYEEGTALLSDLMRDKSPRLDLLRAMDAAIDSGDTGRRAVVEIQVRFLIAAMAAGASDLDMSEEDLRAMLMRQAEERAPQTEMFGLMSNAWTYRDISDADLAAYVAALETPEIRGVYEILNATQFQIMIERYEVLGRRLGELQPEQEL
jgi:hypothetical protein